MEKSVISTKAVCFLNRKYQVRKKKAKKRNKQRRKKNYIKHENEMRLG